MKLVNSVTGGELEIRPIEVAFEGYGLLTADPKTFSSGSIGLYAGGKLEDKAGNRFQVTCSIVLIGSKPQA